MAAKREKALQFRVTDEEDKEFRDWADRLDMSFSEFIRRAARLGAVQLAAFPLLRSLDLEYAEKDTKQQ